MDIRRATDDDHIGVWEILEPVFRAGDTYTIDADISRDDALAYWFDVQKQTFVAEADGRIIGTYYIRANQAGGGAHVCNCGYMTHPAARGQGVARAMLEHSLDLAPRIGYRAMQYNFVVSTNTRAVQTWQRYGFDIVGTLPMAFHHPQMGDVDAYVMYKHL
ncbi:MAG: GNAT family N-acetyltransferase [Paracoccaceae bacterium]|jgi:GNAT superfamily N-acetyltransferase